MSRIRHHLSYANVISTLCLFLLLGGGTAVALNGTNTVQSDDLGPGAQVKAPDVADNAVNSRDVVNERLTGADIKNQSGVDTCIGGSIRLGPLCAGAADVGDTWPEAVNRCAALDLRLPSLGEALALAEKHGIPNSVPEIWTEERFGSVNERAAYVVGGTGNNAGFVGKTMENHSGTACVTTPTN
jgi:hypothetical protein